MKEDNLLFFPLPIFSCSFFFIFTSCTKVSLFFLFSIFSLLLIPFLLHLLIYIPQIFNLPRNPFFFHFFSLFYLTCLPSFVFHLKDMDNPLYYTTHSLLFLLIHIPQILHSLMNSLIHLYLF